MTTTWNAFEWLLHTFDDLLASFPPTRGWSWGWAAVLLTVVCRVVLLPTVVLQVRFQRRMDALQPEIDAIRAKHGVDLAGLRSDPARYAASWVKSEDEQGELLKRNGVRWYLGLLPALLQIPVVVLVLQVLGSEEQTSGLTPATWGFVPSPTASFVHSDEGDVLLALVSVLIAALVHTGQRRSLASAAHPPSVPARRLRLFVLPPAAGLVTLNFGLAVLVSLVTALVWGRGQAAWVESRRRATTVQQQEATTS